MITAGIDIGSVTTKAVILGEEKVLARATCLTGAYPQRAAQEVLEKALGGEATLSRTDIGYIVSTGYGRRSIDFGDRVVTEISAAGRGASYMGSSNGAVRTVIDLGGQDSKVISLDEEGKVVDFVMNDRCAAGTGRFLEVISGILEMELGDLGKISLGSESPIVISSICTVFAESEVISLIAQAKSKADIIAGVHASIAERIYGMLAKIGTKKTVAFVGGGAKNIGVKKAIEDKLQTEVHIPDWPQLVVALGAALIAQKFSL